MNKLNTIGIVIMAVGLINVGFWGLAQRELNRVSQPGTHGQENIPFLKIALRIYSDIPNQPIPREQFATQKIYRNAWLACAMVALGCVVLTVGKKGTTPTIAHYASVAMLGGASFMAMSPHLNSFMRGY